MARITVEDCLEVVDNRFELVMMAAKRARQLANGAEAHVDWENDKATVVALREIAEGHVGAAVLDEADNPFAAQQAAEAEAAAMNDDDDLPPLAGEASADI